jgi:hypothetical protein
VNYALGNALAIEVRHFFKKQEIFENDGAARAHGEGILVIAYRTASVRGHDVLFFVRH